MPRSHGDFAAREGSRARYSRWRTSHPNLLTGARHAERRDVPAIRLQAVRGCAIRPALPPGRSLRSAKKRTTATSRAQTTAVELVIKEFWHWLTTTPARAHNTAAPYAR